MIELTRRAAALAAASALLLPPSSRRAAAQRSLGFAGARIGAIEVAVLSDGHMTVGLDRLAAAAPPEEFKRALGGAGIAGEAHRFAVNVTLLRSGGKTILIDAGAGGTWVDTAGKLSETLDAGAIKPESVDLVVLTHAHPDHLWGVIDDFDDSLRFANASYVLPEPEFQFWMSAAATAGVAEGVLAGARRVLQRLEPKLARARAGAELLPGIAYLDAGGHTPGQCAVLARSGGETLVVGADTVFHPVISVEHPDWQPAQDMDGARAVASRRRLLDVAATEKALFVAYHAPYPGIGRIARRGGGFVWTAA